MQSCPYNWKSAWQHPWQIACGGNEAPFIMNSQWYIYVLNVEEKQYYYYSFKEDMFLTEKEFQDRNSSWQTLLNKEKAMFTK